MVWVFLLEETLNLDYKLSRGTSAEVLAIKFDPREFADTQFSNDPLAPPYTLRYCPLYLRMRSEDGVLFTLRPKTYGFSHSFTFAGYRVQVDDIKRTQFVVTTPNDTTDYASEGESLRADE